MSPSAAARAPAPTKTSFRNVRRGNRCPGALFAFIYLTCTPGPPTRRSHFCLPALFAAVHCDTGTPAAPFIYPFQRYIVSQYLLLLLLILPLLLTLLIIDLNLTPPSKTGVSSSIPHPSMPIHAPRCSRPSYSMPVPHPPTVFGLVKLSS